MAEPLEHLPPDVEVIDTEFSRLPVDERRRRTQAWLDSLDELEPMDLGRPAADILAEVRREEGWD